MVNVQAWLAEDPARHAPPQLRFEESPQVSPRHLSQGWPEAEVKHYQDNFDTFMGVPQPEYELANDKTQLIPQAWEPYPLWNTLSMAPFYDLPQDQRCYNSNPIVEFFR